MLPLPSPERFLCEADPILARLIPHLALPPLAGSGNVFADVMGCLIEQQIPYRSTKKYFQRLLDMAGLADLHPWNFEEFERAALHTAKLSASKSASIAAVLEAWARMPQDWADLDDEAVRKALLSIKGIGPWTVDMILLYTLQRPNIFPEGDFHLKQIMMQLYELPTSGLRSRMLGIASAWEGQKSLAVRYLLAWKAAKRRL